MLFFWKISTAFLIGVTHLLTHMLIKWLVIIEASKCIRDKYQMLVFSLCYEPCMFLHGEFQHFTLLLLANYCFFNKITNLLKFFKKLLK